MTLADDVGCLQPIKAYFTNVEVKLKQEPTFGKLRRMFIVSCVAAAVLFIVRGHFNSNPIREGDLATYKCVRDQPKFEQLRDRTLRAEAQTFFQGVGLDAFWRTFLNAQSPPLAPDVGRTTVPGASFVDASRVVDHYVATPSFHPYLVDACSAALSWQLRKFQVYSQVCQDSRFVGTDYSAAVGRGMGADVAAFMCNEAETRLFSEVFPLLDELYVPDGFESPLNSTDCPTVMAYVLNNSTLTDICMEATRTQLRFQGLAASCPALIAIPQKADSAAEVASLQCGPSEWFSMLDFACNSAVQFAGALLLGGGVVSLVALYDALDGMFCGCCVKAKTRKQRRLERLAARQQQGSFDSRSGSGDMAVQLNPVSSVSKMPA